MIHQLCKKYEHLLFFLIFSILIIHYKDSKDNRFWYICNCDYIQLHAIARDIA